MSDPDTVTLGMASRLIGKSGSYFKMLHTRYEPEGFPEPVSEPVLGPAHYSLRELVEWDTRRKQTSNERKRVGLKQYQPKDTPDGTA